jgi:hypothetical protein
MAVSKERQALEKDVASGLLAMGYARVERGKFAKRIGQETDVFVYPQVGSKSSILELQPIVGIENVTLRSRLQILGKEDADLRVGYALLGTVPGVSELWGGRFILWQPKGQSTAPMVELFIAAMEKIVCPRFSAYDSVEKVITLIERYIESSTFGDLIVADAREKLSILKPH